MIDTTAKVIGGMLNPAGVIGIDGPILRKLETATEAVRRFGADLRAHEQER